MTINPKKMDPANDGGEPDFSKVNAYDLLSGFSEIVARELRVLHDRLGDLEAENAKLRREWDAEK